MIVFLQILQLLVVVSTTSCLSAFASSSSVNSAVGGLHRKTNRGGGGGGGVVLISQENDPNLQYICKGALGEFAACQCNDEDAEVACINAQFVDTAVFQYINSYYGSLKRITFHGNNFQDLPNRALFGDGIVYENLRVLNISANYIVNLHRNALQNMPAVEELDLSNNEIVLTEANVDFLSFTPKLKKVSERRCLK